MVQTSGSVSGHVQDPAELARISRQTDEDPGRGAVITGRNPYSNWDPGLAPGGHQLVSAEPCPPPLHQHLAS